MQTLSEIKSQFKKFLDAADRIDEIGEFIEAIRGELSALNSEVKRLGAEAQKGVPVERAFAIHDRLKEIHARSEALRREAAPLEADALAAMDDLIEQAIPLLNSMQRDMVEPILKQASPDFTDAQKARIKQQCPQFKWN